MKHERLTDKIIAETLKNTVEKNWDSDSPEAQCYIRLAELEDKIEAGTLVEVPKEVVIYTPNVVLTTEERCEEMRICNEERKQVVKDVLLTMLDRMDRLTGCGVPYHVKKFINEIAAENGIELVKENEE